jgi:hypothetical protein
VSGRVTNLADHPSKAFQVMTTVLIESRPDAAVKLKRGEELFVIRRHREPLRPGYVGPDEIYVAGEALAESGWPVLLCYVRSTHADRWVGLDGATCTRMVNRANAHLQSLGIEAGTSTPPPADPINPRREGI